MAYVSTRTINYSVIMNNNRENNRENNRKNNNRENNRGNNSRGSYNRENNKKWDPVKTIKINKIRLASWPSVNQWQNVLLSNINYKDELFKKKLLDQLSSPRKSFGITADDLSFIINNKLKKIIENNIIIYFGHIFYSDFNSTIWFEKWIKSNIKDYAIIEKARFINGKNKLWNYNTYGLNNCLIENNIGPLVIGFLNIFWGKKKRSRTGSLQVGLTLIKSFSIFFENFSNYEEFYFLISKIRDRVCSYLETKVFYFLKNLVNLFWGKLEKLKLMIIDFKLFFFFKKIPLNIKKVSKIFGKLLQYGISRKYDSFFWSNRKFFIELTKKCNLKGKLHFFVKILFNFPRLLTSKGIDDFKKIRLSFILEQFKKNIYIFFLEQFKKLNNKDFFMLLKNSVCSDLFFFNGNCFSINGLLKLNKYLVKASSNYLSDSFFFKNLLPFISNFNDKIFNKFLFFNKSLSFYIKLNFFFSTALNFGSLFLNFFFWNLTLLDNFLKLFNSFIYFWWLKHFYLILFFFMTHSIFFNSNCFFNVCIVYSAKDFFFSFSYNSSKFKLYYVNWKYMQNFFCNLSLGYKLRFRIRSLIFSLNFNS